MNYVNEIEKIMQELLLLKVRLSNLEQVTNDIRNELKAGREKTKLPLVYTNFEGEHGTLTTAQCGQCGFITSCYLDGFTDDGDVFICENCYDNKYL